MYLCLAPSRGRGPCFLIEASRSGVFACLGVLLATACGSPSEALPALVIQHEIAPWPPRIGPAVVTVRLTGTLRKAVTGAHILLEANMSHAGMSPSFGEAKEVEPGRYQAPLAFTMAGDWVILAHVTLADGHKLERQIEVNGVGRTQ